MLQRKIFNVLIKTRH